MGYTRESAFYKWSKQSACWICTLLMWLQHDIQIYKKTYTEYSEDEEREKDQMNDGQIKHKREREQSEKVG